MLRMYLVYRNGEGLYYVCIVRTESAVYNLHVDLYLYARKCVLSSANWKNSFSEPSNPVLLRGVCVWRIPSLNLFIRYTDART